MAIYRLYGTNIIEFDQFEAIPSDSDGFLPSKIPAVIEPCVPFVLQSQNPGQQPELNSMTPVGCGCNRELAEIVTIFQHTRDFFAGGAITKTNMNEFTIKTLLLSFEFNNYCDHR